MGAGKNVDPGRPSFRAAVTSPTALPSLLASLVLVACVFLPHSVGNARTNRPLNLLMASMGEDNAVLMLTVLWPYWFGFATAAVMLTLAVLRPPGFCKLLLCLPTACGFGLFFLWAVLLFSRAEESRSAMMIAAIVIPIGACVVARMVWLFLAGQTIAAATWGQSLLCVLAVFSLRWFWFPPVTGLLWGGVLSILAAALMMLASWTWMTRARHDLFDRSTDPAPFQISLRGLIIGISLVAIALTYWRVVATWN